MDNELLGVRKRIRPSGSIFSSFQNGEFLKDGDGAEPSTATLVDLDITTDTLTQVYLGMCAYNERYYNYSCTTPGVFGSYVAVRK